MVPRTILYKRPKIRSLGGVEAYVGLVLERKFPLSADQDWRASRLKEFIDRHPDRLSRDVTDLYKQIGLSLSGRQGRRVFKLSIGMGIGEYLNYKRLAVAAERLQKTDAPVKTIAADAGYPQTRSFARRFKKLFRLSPMEFRRLWRRRQFAA